MTQLEHASAASELCPICHSPLTERWLNRSLSAKSINGVIVCPRCRYGLVARRIGAHVVDLGVLYPIAFGAFYVTLTFPSLRISGTLSVETVLGYLVAFGIPYAIFCLRDSVAGRSPGKLLFGLQVINWDTRRPIGLVASFKRNLILLIPYIEVLLVFTLGKGWRPGDGWANTRVIRRKHIHKAPFDLRGFVCSKCGYDLTGNESGVCPECGEPVRPSPRAKPVTLV